MSFRVIIIFIISVIFIFTTPPRSYTQTSAYSHQIITGEVRTEIIESVTLLLNQTPLQEALAKFSDLTGIILVYSMNEEKLRQPVTTEILFDPPITALRKIISGTGLEIMLSSSGRIVLIPSIGDYYYNGDIAGRVLDHQTGNPIPRVNIYVEELQLGTTTNNEGRFNIQNMPVGRYTIRASHVAYETVKQEVYVSRDAALYESFSLNPAVFEFGDIYINDRDARINSGGLGVSGTNITQEDITEPGRSGVGQVLRARVAGISFLEYGGGTGFGHLQFRGVGSFHNPSDYTRINVDGIPVDGIFWETFVTDNMSRIEVLRGPQASGRYGANAMSGVINLYTDTGKEGAMGARLSAAGGLAKSSSNDFDPLWQEYFGSIGGGSDIITSGISIRHTRDEGILVNRQSRLSAITLGTKIQPTGKFSVRGSFRFSALDSGWPYAQNIRTLTDISLMNPDISSQQQRGIGSINVDVGLFDWWKQKITVGSEYMYGTLVYNTNEHDITNEDHIVIERVTMHERDLHIRPTVHYNSKFILAIRDTEYMTLSGGLEIQRENRTRDIRREQNDTFERLFDGGSEQNIIGKYLSWSFHTTDNLDVTVGFRTDQVRAEGKTFNYPMSPSLNIGYRFDVTDTWLGIVRGSIGRGIRHPHYSMIFGRPPAELPNPDLKAEIMDGWEAGLSNYLLEGAISVSTTYFSQNTRNAFQPVSFRDIYRRADQKQEFNSFRWINGGSVSNRGLEIEAQIIPARWIRLGMAHIFHWNRAIDLSQEDPHEFTLLRVPDVAGSFFMAVHPVSNLHFNVDIYYVGERLDVDIEAWHNEGRLKDLNEYEKMFSPYMKIDFFGRYLIFDEHELFFNIYNLLNDMSREYSGMPPAGRMIILGFRYSI